MLGDLSMTCPYMVTIIVLQTPVLNGLLKVIVVPWLLNGVWRLYHPGLMMSDEVKPGKDIINLGMVQPIPIYKPWYSWLVS